MDATEEKHFKDFSTDGNVILIVGEQKTARLMVSSQVLCCAFKVFPLSLPRTSSWPCTWSDVISITFGKRLGLLSLESSKTADHWKLATLTPPHGQFANYQIGDILQLSSIKKVYEADNGLGVLIMNEARARGPMIPQMPLL